MSEYLDLPAGWQNKFKQPLSEWENTMTRPWRKAKTGNPLERRLAPAAGH
ncbi:MAG: hypothetical protein IT262_05750 [Saprospiraceae bacterium]|nr:hypothetical protein [Saprospiraceae bacterium]